MVSASSALADGALEFIQLKDRDRAQLQSCFDTFAVPKAQQDSLITSFLDGKMWKCVTNAESPVASEQLLRNGVRWNLDRFSDGSVRANGIGTPEFSQGHTPRGVNDCGYEPGKKGNFANCNIYYWVGLVQSGFRANFTVVHRGWDKITSVWAPSFTAIGACSANVPEPSIVKRTESPTGAAVAGFTPSATMCATNYSTTFPSYLHVGGDQATHHFQ
ncbi:hypothetical protein [Leucobacter luti]|uniref:hypothetical protein n=1 Tax=Leucobacter luti TaxID=340320 RepID=UPI003D058F86